MIPEPKKHTETARFLRAKREAEGVCVLGCGRIPEPGKKRCPTCLRGSGAKVSARQKAKRKKAKKLGLCYKCPLSKWVGALPGKVLCAKHTAEMRTYRIRLYKRRRKQNLCSQCGRNPSVAGVLCADCSKKNKTRGPIRHVTRERLISENLCTTSCCGNIAVKGYLCVGCAKEAAEKQRRRRADRIAKGLCAKCGKRGVRVPGTSCGLCRRKRRVSDPKKPGVIKCSKCEGNHRCSSPKCPMRNKASC